MRWSTSTPIALVVGSALAIGVMVAPGPAAAAPGDPVSLESGRAISLQVTTPGFTTRYLRHQAGVVRTDSIDGEGAERVRREATFTVRAALDGTDCYSLESLDSPGEYLRHRGSRLVQGRPDGSELFRLDATLCARVGLSGTGISLESGNLPGRYLRHRGAEVWLDPTRDDALFRQDASWTVVAPLASETAPLATTDTPDLGPEVTVFDPSMPAEEIQAQIDAAFSAELRSPTAQFGEQRDTFLFTPGDYGRIFANIGYYTTIAGLGRDPDDVTITGAVNVDAGWNLRDEANATQNFWRSVENLAIVPESGTNRWAVSQAAPMRRVHIRGDLTLAPSNQDINTQQGYAGGGFLADSRVDGRVSSGSQQQWYSRDSAIGGWDGGVWNMVYSGVEGAPTQSFPTPPNTTLDSTPLSKEKPYLYLDDAGLYRVFVPSPRRDATGTSWPGTPGDSLAMSRFYVAKSGVSAATLNQALDQGLNLFFTPGVYRLDDTIRVTRPDTVVIGLGFPSLVPTGGVNAMSVADVDGVSVSGLLFDADTVNSAELLTVGGPDASADHSDDPTVIQDVYFRVGGPVEGRATTSLVVNSDDVLLDHIWAWRADHGSARTGWTVNPADTGVLVNGDDVLATGLFAEHYQKHQVLWNGERGHTIFYQSELPYDVPDQAAWASPTGAGYASYKVADGVRDHQVWGGGVYCYFNLNPAVRAARAFEVPRTPGVRLRSILTVSLGDVGSIDAVVNDVGGGVPVPEGSTIPRNVVEYSG